MPQMFQVNGVDYDYITKPDWADESQTGQAGLDGYETLNRWRRLTAMGPEGMPAADFDALFALEGQRVSVTVPDYNDRNGADYKTYYGAVLERVDGRHESINVVGVLCEFRVRI